MSERHHSVVFTWLHEGGDGFFVSGHLVKAGNEDEAINKAKSKIGARSIGHIAVDQTKMGTLLSTTALDVEEHVKRIRNQEKGAN